jgi:hypothetical protein
LGSDNQGNTLSVQWEKELQNIGKALEVITDLRSEIEELPVFLCFK